MKILKNNLQFTGAIKKRTETKYIVLHHPDAQFCTVEDIHKWHLQRGFTGIGYNFFIRKDGTVYEGRGLEAVGAHCKNYNSISVGVSVEGAYNSKDKTMPDAQFKAVVEVLDYLKGLYPNAKIVGHKDLASTACPGKYFPLARFKNYKNELEKVNGGEVVKRYKTVADVPESYSQVIKKLVDKGVIKGDGKGQIDLSEDMCRMLVFVDRMIG